MRTIILSSVLLSCAALLTIQVERPVAQTYPVDIDLTPYDPREMSRDYFRNYPSPYYPVDSVYSSTSVLGTHAKRGYPARSCTFSGLSDTLRVYIRFHLAEVEFLILDNLHPEDWFKPVIFEVEDDILNTSPTYDATELEFEFKGWRDFGEIVSQPDTITLDNEWHALVMDVWNLPEGTYRLGITQHKEPPSGVYVRTESVVYNLGRANSLTDTINALVENVRRAIEDNDYSAAKSFKDSIIDLNEYSVPGWAMSAGFSWAVGDSAGVVDSYDNAIYYLEELRDPLIPDTSSAFKSYLNKRWYNRHLEIFRHELASYKAYPEIR